MSKRRSTLEQGSEENLEDNESFIDSIKAFSKNLESEKISIDLQNQFLSQAEAKGRDTLP